MSFTETTLPFCAALYCADLVICFVNQSDEAVSFFYTYDVVQILSTIRRISYCNFCRIDIGSNSSPCAIFDRESKSSSVSIHPVLGIFIMRMFCFLPSSIRSYFDHLRNSALCRRPIVCARAISETAPANIEQNPRFSKKEKRGFDLREKLKRLLTNPFAATPW